MAITFEEVREVEVARPSGGRGRNVTSLPEIKQVLDKVRGLKEGNVLRVYHDNCHRRRIGYRCLLQKRLASKSVKRLELIDKVWHEGEGKLIIRKKHYRRESS